MTLLLAAMAFVLVSWAATTNAWAQSDFDGDGVVPPADCNPLDGAIAPGKPDKPDLAMVDMNCDGIDGDLAKAVFVSASAANDAGSGSKENPLRTFTAAIAKAKAEGKDVYAITGTYDQGTVQLEDNVGIYGGYILVTGARSTTEKTIIKGSPQAIFADGDTGVVLQMLFLEGNAPAGAGQSAYGVRAINASTLALSRVNATVGPAQNGALGGGGFTGPQGFGGGGGATGLACVGVGFNAGAGGGGGGASAQAGGTGGRGGDSGDPSGRDGVQGQSSSGGGNGGTGADQSGALGGPGTGGNNGANATVVGSTGASPAFTNGSASTTWLGASGGNGGTGNPGFGGGGGGGGASGWNGAPSVDAHGGGGGGGGGGGFGGGGGGGGTFGGGSFGVYAHNSKIAVDRSSFITGKGGNGGNGNLGGPGGGGGIGGPGGGSPVCTIPEPDTNGGDGGKGGNGGTGTAGGVGGGGTGGPSFGVAAFGPTGSFAFRASTTTLGDGGTGGTQAANPAVKAGNGLSQQTAGAASNSSNFDGDGFADVNDKCPELAGTDEGCPALGQVADADGDGIPDSSDSCPNEARGSNDLNGDGCPDAPPPPVVITQPPTGGGGQADPTRILIAMPFAFSKATNKFTIFAILQVKAIPIGSLLKVTCKAPKGKKCPAKSFTKRNAFGTVNLKKWTKKKIPAGTKLTVTVTKPGNFIGAVKIMTVQKKKRPKFADRCTLPGSSKPVGC